MKLKDEILYYISKNLEKYKIVFQGKNFLVIGFKKELTTYSVNRNSVFQPRTSHDKKTFCLLIVIKLISTSSDEDDEMKEWIDMGSYPIIILDESTINTKMKNLETL